MLDRLRENLREPEPKFFFGRRLGTKVKCIEICCFDFVSASRLFVVSLHAGMAELADASDSKSDARKGVSVRPGLPAFLTSRFFKLVDELFKGGEADPPKSFNV